MTAAEKTDPAKSLSERLRGTFDAWNNPLSDGLPDGASILIEAADRLAAFEDQVECTSILWIAETRENERLREALEAIIRRDRVHGIDPNSKSERQVWFDGPCAEIARAALVKADSATEEWLQRHPDEKGFTDARADMLDALIAADGLLRDPGGTGKPS